MKSDLVISNAYYLGCPINLNGTNRFKPVKPLT